MRTHILLPLFFWCSAAPAAFEWSAQGARCASLGGAGATLASDPFAAAVNPALLGSLHGPTIGAFHSPGLFSLPELSAFSAVLAAPVGSGGGLLRFSRFGSGAYSESRLGVAWGMALSGELQAGVRLDVDHLAIAGYGATCILSLSAGATASPVPRVMVGFVLDNLVGTAPARSLERPPFAMEAGLMVEAVDDVRLHFRMSKDPLFPLEVASAVEVVLGNTLLLRGGATIEPSTWSGGVGCSFAAFDIDYALTAHPALGITQMISLVLRPGEF